MNKSGKYEIDMCNGPLVGKIIRFTIPLILTSVLQLLFNAADIVVVGYGFAGMNAALEAANRGAHVVLLEKTEQRGGSMRLAGGTLSGAGTKIQAEQGIEDSPELFYEEIVSRNAAIGGEANYLPDVSKYYCEHSG